MGKKLTRDDDVQASNESFENEGGGGRILKIGEGKTPVYLLSDDYADGYVHWTTLPDGGRKRLVCLGGLEGKGWAPDNCPLCQMTASIYKKAKAAEGQGNKDLAETIRRRASGMRAKYEAHFLAVKGEMVKEKRGDKKVFVPDFEEGTVGLLSMTKQQFEQFTGLRSNPEYPFMKGSQDLVNRVFVLDKAKREGSSFATTLFIPSKHVSDAPDVEYEAAEFEDMEADFETDADAMDSAVELLAAVEDEDFTSDEDDSDRKPSKSSKAGKAAKKPVDEDDFFDEDDEDEAPKKGKKAAAKAEEEDDDDADDGFVDDFEDDIPEPPKAKGKGKK